MLMMQQLKQIVQVFTIKGQNLKRQYLNLKISRLKNCGTDVKLGSNGTIDLSEYNGNAITIDIDYEINDGKKHRISPRGVSKADLNKIKFVKNSGKLYKVDLKI